HRQLGQLPDDGELDHGREPDQDPGRAGHHRQPRPGTRRHPADRVHRLLMSAIPSPRQPGPLARAGLFRRVRRASLRPLLWLGPAIALIAVVVIWPIVAMIQTSFRHITPLGIDIGSAGGSNFSAIFGNPNLPGILVRTVIWVATVVA